MLFGIVGQTDTGIRQVVEFGDRSTGRGIFGGDFGARHCNQWGLAMAYVCDSATTLPSSQITLGGLVIIIVINCSSSNMTGVSTNIYYTEGSICTKH